jgi:nitrogen fixation NifU-like protein
MDPELRELYQQVILDHHRHPRNHRDLEDANRRAEGYNPLCGDRINVELRLGPDGVVEDVGFSGQGCAICTASASMMTECVKGKSADDARALFEGFHDLLTEESYEEARATDLGKLAVFAGVREFPVRVKCATLPWHTFRSALDQEGRLVSTE